MPSLRPDLNWRSAVRTDGKGVLIVYLHHGDSKAGFPEAVSVFQPVVDSIVWE